MKDRMDKILAARQHLIHAEALIRQAIEGTCYDEYESLADVIRKMNLEDSEQSEGLTLRNLWDLMSEFDESHPDSDDEQFIPKIKPDKYGNF